jgi:hypothetical protein
MCESTSLVAHAAVSTYPHPAGVIHVMFRAARPRTKPRQMSTHNEIVRRESDKPLRDSPQQGTAKNPYSRSHQAAAS